MSNGGIILLLSVVLIILGIYLCFLHIANNKNIKKFLREYENHTYYKGRFELAGSEIASLKIELQQLLERYNVVSTARETFKKKWPSMIAIEKVNFTLDFIQKICMFYLGGLTLEGDEALHTDIKRKRALSVMDALGLIYINYEGELTLESFKPSTILSYHGLNVEMTDHEERYKKYIESYNGSGLISCEFILASIPSLEEIVNIWHGNTETQESGIDPALKEVFNVLKDVKERSRLASEYALANNKYQHDIEALKNEGLNKFVSLSSALKAVFDKYLKGKEYPFDRAVKLNDVIQSKDYNELIKALNALK